MGKKSALSSVWRLAAEIPQRIVNFTAPLPAGYNSEEASQCGQIAGQAGCVFSQQALSLDSVISGKAASHVETRPADRQKAGDEVLPSAKEVAQEQNGAEEGSEEEVKGWQPATIVAMRRLPSAACRGIELDMPRRRGSLDPGQGEELGLSLLPLPGGQPRVKSLPGALFRIECASCMPRSGWACKPPECPADFAEYRHFTSVKGGFQK